MMSALGRIFLLFTIVAMLLLAGCEKSNSEILSSMTPSPTPSLAILETPEEIAIELPPAYSAQEIPAVQTPMIVQ